MSKTFSTSRTAQILDISTQTLKRWYKWYNSDEYEKPPELKFPDPTFDSKGTMFFTIKQVQVLEQFKLDLQDKYRGCMADFNSRYCWQKGTVKDIGKQFRKKKGEDDE
nr:MAG TPA: MerR HTH family regulatory protein [Caudoviricetes sp.]